MKNKSDYDLSQEVMRLSIFGLSAGIGFIAGLIWDLLLASSALFVCAVCFLRIAMIRRVKKVRLPTTSSINSAARQFLPVQLRSHLAAFVLASIRR